MLNRFPTRPEGLLALILTGFSMAGHLRAQTKGDAELNGAYQAAARKEYDAAVELFRKGLEQQPANAGAHKDFAYTLLKTGENAQARDEFEKALKLKPGDETAALEFGFLAFETGKPREARSTFERLRHSASAATKATAEQAFANIDGPLAAGIARWKEALSRAADANALSTYSAHWELAQTAELRDEWTLATEQYEICHKLKPQLPELLLILARVWQELGRMEEAQAALLAASRSKDSRTAELALEQMGTRYPYPYEFGAALKLDPGNVTLRRELGFLYLAMQKEADAAEQLQIVLALDPSDAVVRKQLDFMRGYKTRPEEKVATATAAEPALDARAMGKKSLGLGYLPDAIKYLQLAHEQDPADADVMLELGFAYNQSKDDGEALEWFDRARHSDDSFVAAQASQAFHNLRGDVLPQTTVWTLPMFSTRWKDLFSYGQIKQTVPLPWLGKTDKYVSFYLSTRFMGDVRSTLTEHTPDPQYLSESSFIFAGGVSTKTWHHLTAWAEAGEAVKYLPWRQDVGGAIPDYRGGLNFAKGFGALLGSKAPGFFYETTADALYVSRYDKDWLFYSQNRTGRTFRLGGTSAQALFNVNYLHDLKNQGWANTVEIGPGLRLHLPHMPPNMYFATDYLHGFYTVPYTRPNYQDLRVSLWYAVTK